MRKSEAEPVIRKLCHAWRREEALLETQAASLSFSDFWNWLQANYSNYLSFRSSISVRYDVELWFDQEFGQAGNR